MNTPHLITVYHTAHANSQTVQKYTFISVLHTNDASPYRAIATSTKRSRGGGERKKKDRHTVS